MVNWRFLRYKSFQFQTSSQFSSTHSYERLLAQWDVCGARRWDLGSFEEGAGFPSSRPSDTQVRKSSSFSHAQYRIYPSRPSVGQASGPSGGPSLPPSSSFSNSSNAGPPARPRARLRIRSHAPHFRINKRDEHYKELLSSSIPSHEAVGPLLFLLLLFLEVGMRLFPHREKESGRSSSLGLEIARVAVLHHFILCLVRVKLPLLRGNCSQSCVIKTVM